MIAIIITLTGIIFGISIGLIINVLYNDEKVNKTDQNLDISKNIIRCHECNEENKKEYKFCRGCSSKLIFKN